MFGWENGKGWGPCQKARRCGKGAREGFEVVGGVGIGICPMCWFVIPRPGYVLFPSLVTHAVPCSRPVSVSMSLWLVHEHIEVV